MRTILWVASLALVSAGVLYARQDAAQQKAADKTTEKSADKPADKPADAPAASAAKKDNPVKATPEVLAAAKKVFGYDCAMCHGETGDGKGELVESMKLTTIDWRQSTVVSGMSDGDIYDLIVKGKDKMVGEGDRLAPAKVWGLVLYVRTLNKKNAT
ncbi:MAG TPA: cytochrome c [Candidatus Acidoferrum sp.]|jgi:cytochrome c5